MSAGTANAAFTPLRGMYSLTASRSTFVFAAACFAVVLFALVPSSTRIAGLQLDGLSIGLIRAVGAGLLTAPLLLICRLRPPNNKKDVGLLLVYAFANFAGFPVLFSLGTQKTSGAHVALVQITLGAAVLANISLVWALARGGLVRVAPLQFAQPVCALFFASALLNERLTSSLLLVAAAIVCGIV